MASQDMLFDTSANCVKLELESPMIDDDIDWSLCLYNGMQVASSSDINGRGGSRKSTFQLFGAQFWLPLEINVRADYVRLWVPDTRSLNTISNAAIDMELVNLANASISIMVGQRVLFGSSYDRGQGDTIGFGVVGSMFVKGWNEKSSLSTKQPSSFDVVGPKSVEHGVEKSIGSTTNLWKPDVSGLHIYVEWKQTFVVCDGT